MEVRLTRTNDDVGYPAMNETASARLVVVVRIDPQSSPPFRASSSRAARNITDTPQHSTDPAGGCSSCAWSFFLGDPVAGRGWGDS
jgi:hypothetical protein